MTSETGRQGDWSWGLETDDECPGAEDSALWGERGLTMARDLGRFWGDLGGAKSAGKPLTGFEQVSELIKSAFLMNLYGLLVEKFLGFTFEVFLQHIRFSMCTVGCHPIQADHHHLLEAPSLNHLPALSLNLRALPALPPNTHSIHMAAGVFF